MKLKKSHWLLIFFNLAYILIFASYYISIENYEFLWYVGVLVFFFIVVAATLERSKFNNLILWGLSIWGLLHMAGGGLIIGGEVLYKFMIVDLVVDENIQILKFDQFVHFFGFGVSTLVGYHLLRPYLSGKTNYKVVYPLLVCVGMGIGSLNEIVEFIAVLSFPETGVGGYYNTALDLVFNMVGSIFGVLVIHLKKDI